MKKGDKVRAAKALETLIGYSHTDVRSARELTALVDVNKEPARMQLALKRIVSVDPFDGAAHSQLGRLALSRQRQCGGRAAVPRRARGETA